MGPVCGICGWVDWDGTADERVVRRMMTSLAHRGPDGEGVWRDPTGVAVLGHRRLKVLDLSAAAHQPMRDPAGQVLVYNGEVYSYRQLRADLEAAGRPVASSGDTEVVLASLARWGSAALDRFVGMFALALWDPAGRRLLLVRDRFGVKPLFWARAGHGLAFASEVPALLEHPAVRRRVSREALARWLQLGYCCGEETLLDGVWRVPPGHLLEADVDGTRVRPWYDPLQCCEAGPRGPSDPAAAGEEVEPLLRTAVRDRLVSDVPLGCFLSGGVDSTVVVAAARREGALPETLTVAFAGGEDESEVASATAGALGLPHWREECTAGEMEATVAAWPRMAADPVADPSLAPTWVVSRRARERWTVALSGDGGDEMLGGYPRLRVMPRLEGLLRLPPILRRVAVPVLPARRWAAKLEAALAAPTPWAAYQALQGVWPTVEVGRLLGRDDLPPPWPEGLLRRLADRPPWQRYRLLDMVTFLPERVLAKVDRASMSCSLEVRVPLLDHRLVEALLPLPRPACEGKAVLRELVSRLGAPAPPRRKRGFEVPLAAWVRGPLRESVREGVLGTTASELGLDRTLLRRHWEEHQSGRSDHSERLLAVTVLVRWAREWGVA